MRHISSCNIEDIENSSSTARKLGGILIALWCALISLPLSGLAQYHTATKPMPLRFPIDHGSHPRFQTEWWYLTANLWTDTHTPFSDPSDFGVQLTFFRRALVPPLSITSAELDDRTQLYLAHAALGDFGRGSFSHSSRSARGGFAIAGAAPETGSVWNRDWNISLDDSQLFFKFSLPREESYYALSDKSILRSPTSEARIAISSVSLPRPILHGERGLSRKGSCETCASIYYSIPRVLLRGQMRLNGNETPLHGLGWFDHEFMSNSLQENQVGWDWFSLMHEDGTNVMLFTLRSSDGESDFPSGSVQEGEKVRALTKQDFTVTAISHTSQTPSGSRYPIQWRIEIPSLGWHEIITARMNHQELSVPQNTGSNESQLPVYWEGAVSSEDENIVGFAELTGYHKPVGALF